MALSDELAQLAKNARENVPRNGSQIIDPSTGNIHEFQRGLELPSFELYHFGISICSQKVRAVLCEKKVKWLSNELHVESHENYKPDYVRLRLQSDAAKNTELSKVWTGVSSVEKVGFDALVVPTLIDHEAGKIVADSKAICIYLAKKLDSGTDLLPSDLEEEILKEMSLVDQTPHVALLYGGNPYFDSRPIPLKYFIKFVPSQQSHDIMKLMNQLGEDEDRVKEAYQAKLAKVQAAGEFLISEEKKKKAADFTLQMVTDFAKRLESSKGPWIFGERYTMADVFWGLSLFRLHFLGCHHMWENDQKTWKIIDDYTHRNCTRESIAQVAARWPSHPWAKSVARWMRDPSLVERVLNLSASA
uniref:GST N-terminal domain-containing protein n=1 Tax=Aureoumbra lagunensis TaxID=44058 RepID=A0A7S3NKS1_9STRA|mmetsp:Transcript_16467/g.21479  ORF Transcript_16467/g.21479 Transcript_16467/m.21479 type:complete len:360 (+) Transcript_16467:285-1364(+)|eukprot:CAMPEP_0197302096 /NCGR_PEP_ID=MMETSP0890-20130614/50825_1 /TAXON_ID=44058 ORGANISM="Aureoumbra lagunensis, Strain CCMP1510" /NCGR_SAMPLE_ID=MMETSP0890 /ASSEMBLY_ACC=CAM_ASM_000533 /LENGTH=359 /DNA_ID=CAMNT_0042781593 /DNA_START=622 /DNA_END=1701 /DNA_ORIENTATION=+